MQWEMGHLALEADLKIPPIKKKNLSAIDNSKNALRSALYLMVEKLWPISYLMLLEIVRFSLLFVQN